MCCSRFETLNFSFKLAEKLAMKRIDPFFTIIVVLFAFFVVVYETMRADSVSLLIEQKKNADLVEQVEVLKLQQVALLSKSNLNQSGQRRSVASEKTTIPASKEIQLKEVGVTDITRQAESLFNQINQMCEAQKNHLLCVQKVEEMTTQFPETSWAGRSLLKLSEFYIQTHRFEKAKEVMQIVKSEFKNDSRLQKRVLELERLKL